MLLKLDKSIRNYDINMPNIKVDQYIGLSLDSKRGQYIGLGQIPFEVNDPNHFLARCCCCMF